VNSRVVVIGSVFRVGESVGVALGVGTVGVTAGAGVSAVGGGEVKVGDGETGWVVIEGCANPAVLIATGDWQADKENRSNKTSRSVCKQIFIEDICND
jgi:hypothetical protein